MGSEEKLDDLLNNVNYEREKRAKELYTAAKSLLSEDVEKDIAYLDRSDIGSYDKDFTKSSIVNGYGKYTTKKVIEDLLFRFEYDDAGESYSLSIYVETLPLLKHSTVEKVLDMDTYKPPHDDLVSVKFFERGYWEEALMREAETNYKREKRAKELYAAAKSLLSEDVKKYGMQGIDVRGYWLIRRKVGEWLFDFEYRDAGESYSLSIYVEEPSLLKHRTVKKVLDMNAYKPPHDNLVSVNFLSYSSYEEALIKEAKKVRSVGIDGNTETPHVEADIMWVNDETILKR
jgi:hypothetical protein